VIRWGIYACFLRNLLYWRMYLTLNFTCTGNWLLALFWKSACIFSIAGLFSLAIPNKFELWVYNSLINQRIDKTTLYPVQSPNFSFSHQSSQWTTCTLGVKYYFTSYVQEWFSDIAIWLTFLDWQCHQSRWTKKKVVLRKTPILDSEHFILFLDYMIFCTRLLHLF